jgi:hypothetical protein
MRSECVNHKFVYESALQTERLVTTLADLHQKATQSYVRRPYGVGLLVAGYDPRTGPRLFQTCPTGNLFEWKAYALGSRSQAARTYLERNFEGFLPRAWARSPRDRLPPTHARAHAHTYPPTHTHTHAHTHTPQWTATHSSARA